MKPMAEWDDDTAATVAGVEVEEIGERGTIKKLRHWDKSAALDKAMRYLGLYKTDNEQQPPPVVVQPANDLEVLRRIWFVLDRATRKKPPALEAPQPDSKRRAA
jgi:hypothetical protein